jgi:murein DD-endopeptidase MepM/ murein hydrolase activator NlpD
MKMSPTGQLQCYEDISNCCIKEYINPPNACMEPELMRRNDVRRLSSIAGTQLFQRLGYCLSSLGVLSTTLAYTQTIANAQTPAPSATASPSPASRTDDSFPVATNIAPPETVDRPEIAPSPAALEVPEATIAAPMPSPDSRSAADLLPPPATPLPPSEAIAPEETAPVVELIERPAAAPSPAPAPRPAAPSRANPAADKKGIAKTAAQKTTQPTKLPAKAAVKPVAAPVNVPVVQAEIPVAIAEAPVQVGPISLSHNGISFSTTAVQPYFNPQLRLPAMPGLDQLRMGFPIAIPAPITSLFGWRVHPISGAQRLHTGTDIGAPMGAPVMASLGGRVILADNMGGYGIAVAIEHDNGIRQTLYGHMSEIFVRPGDIIQQGTVIGRVGSTGASTGPHLHFELRQMLPDGTWVAQDASQHLEQSMAKLVQSLQIAQQPQKTALKPVQPAR